jgi:Protein of unknown function (DUF3050)
VDSIERLRIFTEHHVFAVWDFICLLKELHRKIVCTQAPWFPPKDAYCAHLIHRILVEEEGDLTEDQQHYLSHFELYLTAMEQIGADTQPIQAFLQLLASGDSLATAVVKLALPDTIQHFITTTFSFFGGEAHTLTAAFVYGREAMTPSLFAPLVRQLDQVWPSKIKWCFCNGFDNNLSRRRPAVPDSQKCSLRHSRAALTE